MDDLASQTTTPTSSQSHAGSFATSSASSQDNSNSHASDGRKSRKRLRRLPQSLFGGETERSNSSSSQSRQLEIQEAATSSSAGLEVKPPGRVDAATGSHTSSSSSLWNVSSQPSLLAPESKFSHLPASTATAAAAAAATIKKASSSSSSSLFGAVMKSVHQPKQDETSTSQTPPPPFLQQQRPQKQPAHRNLMDFVNALSPFQFKSPGKRQRMRLQDSIGMDMESVESPQRTAVAAPSHNDGWHEVRLRDIDNDSDSDSMFVNQQIPDDWSIKESLSIEYSSPRHDLLFESNARVEWLARQQFVTGRQDLTMSTDAATAVCVRLHQALFYWEYSVAVPDFQLSLGNGMKLRDTNNQRVQPKKTATEPGKDVKSASFAGEASQSQAQQAAIHIYNQNRQDARSMPPPFTASTKSASSPNTADAETQQKRNWRQALVSLYRTWIQQLGVAADTDASASCYFYALGVGHSVLFRAACKLKELSASTGLTVTDNHTGGDEHDSLLVPQIVLSSSSRFFRDKLRQRGVSLAYLRPHNESSAFHEADIILARPRQHEKDVFGSDEARGFASTHASPGTKAELVALRQSQVRGATVGPHVKVSMDRHNHRQVNEEKEALQRHLQSIPPLVVNGIDDCSAFLEVYMNMYGQVHYYPKSTDDETIGSCAFYDSQFVVFHLPSLVCRGLGPFEHATMRKLHLTRRLDTQRLQPNGDNQLHVGTEGRINCIGHLEIRGPIQPWAVWSVLDAIVQLMRKAALDGCRTSPAAKYAAPRSLIAHSSDSQSLLSLSDTSSSESSESRTTDSMADLYQVKVQSVAQRSDDGFDDSPFGSLPNRALKSSSMFHNMARIGNASSGSMYSSLCGGPLVNAVWDNGDSSVIACKFGPLVPLP